MCGIFGWSGRNPASFDFNKYNILGIMNEQRGKHSCGVTIDGEIYIGVDKNKLYRDFIISTPLDKPVKYPVVIGHTRHATVGALNEVNAHPFGFGNMNNNNDYKFIGVHNGSLTNYYDLAKKRNIETSEKITEKNVVSYRTKIDSEILLECIYKDNNFSILSEYTGAAALVFTRIDNPNVIYCYHGKSKEFKYSKDTIEERPLFYYKENKYSLYISSIKESLELIAGADIDNIGEFKHNCVYEIKNGDISTAKIYEVDRSECFQKYSAVTTYGYTTNNHKNDDAWDQYDYEDAWSLFGSSKNKNKTSNISNHNSIVNIYNESTSYKIKQRKEIHYEKLRFKCGHDLLTGCYLYINTFGYYRLGDKIKNSEEIFWTLVNQRFYDGDFITDKEITEEIKKKSFIPFVHNDKVEIISPPIYYFFKGVRLLGPHDYIACIDSTKSGGPFSYESLSCCSALPICDDVNYKTSDRQNILLDNKPYSGIIAPLGSKKIYTIKNGKLEKIEDRLEDLRENNVINLPEVVEKLEEENQNSQIDNDMLELKIEELFVQPFEKFTNIMEEFNKEFGHLEKGKAAYSILKDFTEAVHELINVDINQ